MASPATSSHLPALAEPHEREAIAPELRSTMQGLVELSLIGKQLHWAVVGHAFRPVHEQLDELVERILAQSADVVAEPAITLGNMPDGKLAPSQQDHHCRRSRPRRNREFAVVEAITNRIAQVGGTAAPTPGRPEWPGSATQSRTTCDRERGQADARAPPSTVARS